MKGRKRHILTDTDGRLVAAQAHTADIQDRDGAPPLLTSIRALLPWLRHVFADGGYAGDKLREAMAGQGQWKIDIIKRSDMRIPTKPASDSDQSPATHSDFIPAGIPI